MKSKKTRLVAMLVLCSAIFNARAPAQEVAQAPSTEDQAGVIGCLRTINTAELTYANTYKNGFSSNLKALAAPNEGTSYIASAAGLIDASLLGGKRNGYVFTYKAAAPDDQGKISGYTVSARPIKWQKGTQRFFTDQTDVVRSTAENRPATAKDRDIDK